MTQSGLIRENFICTDSTAKWTIKVIAPVVEP